MGSRAVRHVGQFGNLGSWTVGELGQGFELHAAGQGFTHMAIPIRILIPINIPIHIPILIHIPFPILIYIPIPIHTGDQEKFKLLEYTCTLGSSRSLSEQHRWEHGTHWAKVKGHRKRRDAI